MAERRMFAKTIIGSDAFLEMPHSTQNLYFQLSMNADDDGFVANPKTIMRAIGAKDDDIKVLLAKQFVIAFESGIVVIRHWKVHNFLRNDRYKETIHLAEKQLISAMDNGEYVLGIPSDNQMAPQDRIELDKERLGKVRIVESDSALYKFKKPTLEEIANYCSENGYNIDPRAFIDYYESNGWRVGKNPMKDWKASVRLWTRRPQFGKPSQAQPSGETSNPFLNIAMRGAK